jgi:hypothetical protein
LATTSTWSRRKKREAGKRDHVDNSNILEHRLIVVSDYSATSSVVAEAPLLLAVLGAGDAEDGADGDDRAERDADPLLAGDDTVGDRRRESGEKATTPA